MTAEASEDDAGCRLQLMISMAIYGKIWQNEGVLRLNKKLCELEGIPLGNRLPPHGITGPGTNRRINLATRTDQVLSGRCSSTA